MDRTPTQTRFLAEGTAIRLVRSPYLTQIGVADAVIDAWRHSRLIARAIRPHYRPGPPRLFPGWTGKGVDRV